MAQRTAREIVEQAINDFDDIRDAIRGHRIEVPYPTKTSLYAELIANINIGSLSGTHIQLDKFPVLNIIDGHKESLFDHSRSLFGIYTGAAEIISDN